MTDRTTTAIGPRRVRVGYRPADGAARVYHEQESPDGWHVHRRGTGYMMVTSFGKNEAGEDVRGSLIHIFDDAADPRVIVDSENVYGERIDREAMTLAQYLDRHPAAVARVGA